MKLFLDSADPTQWALVPGSPRVQGVTTNPTLVRQAGLPMSLSTYRALIDQAVDARMPELMLQLPLADVAQALQWAHDLSAHATLSGVTLTLKLPCHPSWESVARALSAEGVPFLLTGVANPVQLLWSKDLGAAYVAPYLGRLQGDGRDVWPLVQASVALQTDGPKLLAASIRSLDTLARLIAAGAYAATLRPEFLRSWATDDLTMAAMKQFDEDEQASLRRSPAS